MGGTLSGDIRLHKAESLPFLRHPRDIIVYLPPGYQSAAGERYPVLYLNDGQNLFDPATAFAGQEWGLDELAEELIPAGRIQPLPVRPSGTSGHIQHHQGTFRKCLLSNTPCIRLAVWAQVRILETRRGSEGAAAENPQRT